MDTLALHDFHRKLGGRFLDLSGKEGVEDYGDARAEHAALRESAGALDLSFRGRLCVLGADRRIFLNGQVTNNVKNLKTGQGCYAALVTAKGRMESDLNIYCLENELLLDFEPGLSAAVQGRLEKYIIAEDVQVADAAPHYGLLSAQGPRAAAVVESLGLPVPREALGAARMEDPALGEVVVAGQPRIGSGGFDIFVPAASLAAAAEKLLTATRAAGGRFCGWAALEIARIEAGIPRFGADMDNTHLPPEAGLESRAVSYSKGCYIGQEVIARVRTYGQVAKSLRGLRLPDDLPELPVKGGKLFLGEKEVGVITSAAASPTLKANIALGYVRREAGAPGTELWVAAGGAKVSARIVELPFISPSKSGK
ncbi:MAG: aminomethyltransferase family protein [Verrucomicrobiota bacterium]